jgi:hypothetical protein
MTVLYHGKSELSECSVNQSLQYCFNFAAFGRNSIVGQAEHVTEFMRRTYKG